MQLQEGEEVEYTRFGEEMRVLRTRRHQTQQDMADVLGVSKPFLSAVEAGKKRIPDKWIDILCDHYNLKPYHREILQTAADRSRSQIKINLNGSENYKREVALQFQDHFSSIDEDAAEQIIRILKSKAETQMHDVNQ